MYVIDSLAGCTSSETTMGRITAYPCVVCSESRVPTNPVRDELWTCVGAVVTLGFVISAHEGVVDDDCSVPVAAGCVVDDVSVITGN